MVPLWPSWYYPWVVFHAHTVFASKKFCLCCMTSSCTLSISGGIFSEEGSCNRLSDERWSQFCLVFHCPESFHRHIINALDVINVVDSSDVIYMFQYSWNNPESEMGFLPVIYSQWRTYSILFEGLPEFPIFFYSGGRQK